MIISFGPDAHDGPAAVLYGLKGYAVRLRYKKSKAQHEGVIDEVNVISGTLRLRFFDGKDFLHRGPLMRIDEIEEVIYL